jgi:hypothetical protein
MAVLDHDAPLWLGRHLLSGMKEQVRRGLASRDILRTEDSPGESRV